MPVPDRTDVAYYRSLLSLVADDLETLAAAEPEPMRGKLLARTKRIRDRLAGGVPSAWSDTGARRP